MHEKPQRHVYGSHISAPIQMPDAKKPRWDDIAQGVITAQRGKFINHDL